MWHGWLCRQREWSWVKACGQLLETGKSRMESSPADTLSLAQWNPSQTSDVWNNHRKSKTGKWLGLRNKHSLQWKQGYLPTYGSAYLLHSLSGDRLSLLLQLCLNKSSREFLTILSHRPVTQKNLFSFWLYFQKFCTKSTVVLGQSNCIQEERF